MPFVTVSRYFHTAPVAMSRAGAAPVKVRLIGAEVPVAPWLSVAMAVSANVPTSTLFQSKVKGGPTRSSPIFTPLRKNSTLLTLPPGSLAVVVMVRLVGALNVALFAGEVMLTVGGVLATPVTVMPTGAEVAVTPPLSKATAVRV